MKIVYCLMDSSKAGGMERSICCKANYLADIYGYDITIITTDRESSSDFYKFSPKISFIDLQINYGELAKQPLFRRVRNQIDKRKLHYERLSKVLMSIRADIVISTYTHELSFLYKIKDGSKKIIEAHFSKQFRYVELAKKTKLSLDRLLGVIAEKRKQLVVKHYDAFVVLTKQDRELWKYQKRVEVIPNPVPFFSEKENSNDVSRIISVGRLTPLKGFPLLIAAWKNVVAKHPNWRLDIFGSGNQERLLDRLIERHQLGFSVSINSVTNGIEDEYYKSSIYVMSSVSEGFGLVLAEAMSCGLPCVAFDCPTGPAEIITHGEDGLLVKNKSVTALANAICFLIEDEVMRKEMGENAKLNIQRFLPERIMPRWIALFERLTFSEY